MPTYDFIIVPTLISTFYPPYRFDNLNEHDDDKPNEHVDAIINVHDDDSLIAQYIASMMVQPWDSS